MDFPVYELLYSVYSTVKFDAALVAEAVGEIEVEYACEGLFAVSCIFKIHISRNVCACLRISKLNVSRYRIGYGKCRYLRSFACILVGEGKDVISADILRNGDGEAYFVSAVGRRCCCLFCSFFCFSRRGIRLSRSGFGGCGSVTVPEVIGWVNLTGGSCLLSRSITSVVFGYLATHTIIPISTARAASISRISSF